MSKRASVLDLMLSNVPGIAWPPIVREPVAGLATMLAVLDRTQWMKRRDLVEAQYRQLVVLATHLARQSKQFAPAPARCRADARRSGAAKRAFGACPFCAGAICRFRAAELHCATIPQAHGPLGESRTSGSTGEPVVHPPHRRQPARLARQQHPQPDLAGHRLRQARTTTIRPQFQRYSIKPDRGPPLNQLFKTGPVQAHSHHHRHQAAGGPAARIQAGQSDHLSDQPRSPLPPYQAAWRRAGGAELGLHHRRDAVATGCASRRRGYPGRAGGSTNTLRRKRADRRRMPR